MRLDVYLAAMSDQTRSQIQKLINEGLVLVNEKIKYPHYKVKPDEIIEIKQKKEARKNEKEHQLKIIFQNKDFIVIDKSSGLIVHPPHARSKETALTDLLVKDFPEIKNVGEKTRPGIVHRLDKEVSGLMAATRNTEAYEFLKTEFKERRVKKIYTGLVHGKLRESQGEISFKIARGVKGGRMAARPKSQEGKEALTFYRVIKKFTNFTLVEIELKTGRTHQIRAHFHALGHPLAGDPLYKPKRAGKILPPRIFLHSTILGFNNLNNEWLEFTSPLPEELEQFLTDLKTL